MGEVVKTATGWEIKRVRSRAKRVLLENPDPRLVRRQTRTVFRTPTLRPLQRLPHCRFRELPAAVAPSYCRPHGDSGSTAPIPDGPPLQACRTPCADSS